VEDDVDVWRYAILELHASNDVDDMWATVGWCLTALSAQKGYIMPCEK